VILAGVLVVIGFGAVATRAMRTEHSAAAPAPPPPAPQREVVAPRNQALIPLASPKPTATRKTTDPGALGITSGDVPGVVDLTAEGKKDWVHFGASARDRDGGSAIQETGSKAGHALSPQRFRWTDGTPVASSDGTTTGVRECGKDNGFTLTAPAGTSTRILKLYIGVISAKGRLDATMSAGSARGSSTVDQPAGTLKTAVLTISYRAPEAARLRVDWTTVEAYGTGCGGVALQAAALR
jgi:hypothetical protein